MTLELKPSFTRDQLAEAVDRYRERHRLHALFFRRPGYPGTGRLWVFPLAVERLLELVDSGEVDL